MLRGVNILNEHGPLVFFTTVLLLAGLLLVCFGLIGEMLVRPSSSKIRGFARLGSPADHPGETGIAESNRVWNCRLYK